MAPIPLTADACRRLNNPNDHRALVSKPTLRVTSLQEHEAAPLGGFVVRHSANLVDGDDAQCSVVFSDDADIGSPVGSGDLQDGSLIRIIQILRIPDQDGQTRILVHSAEIVTDDDEVRVTDLDMENRNLRLQLEQALLAQAEQKLDELTQESGLRAEVLPDLIASLVDFALKLGNVTTEALDSWCEYAYHN